jgi:large subunit ribosomal protein L13
MNMTAIIDLKDLVIGRAATHIAKRLLNGERIELINAEKAVIKGPKDYIIAKYKKRVDMAVVGNPHYGPKFSRRPDKIVKVIIRGMLPNITRKRKPELENLRIHIGVPKSLEKEKAETIERAKNREKKNFLYIKDLSSELGLKVHYNG